MPTEEPEEDEYERRFREMEEKARQIREKTTMPDPPKIDFQRPKLLNELGDGSKKNSPQAAKGLGIALAIGYSFVGPILGGILIGSLIDGKAGGTWTVVGIFLGTVAAFTLLIRLVNKLNDNER